MSIINEIFNQQKNVGAQIAALDPDAMKKAEREKNKESMQADIDVSNAGYDSQINNTQAYYDKQIGDTKIAYEDAYQRNAVQKLINEKQIAERNANLGLTDSGLNRTQQTVAQLSYANQKGKIDLARQSALDDLGIKLTDAITTLQNDKATAARKITNDWNAYSDEQAQNTYNTTFTGLVNQYNSLGEQITDMYKADADAAAEVQKAQISASAESEDNGILLYKWGGATEYDDSGATLLKFTGSDGKSYSIAAGKNPYTNTQNAKISEVVNGKCVIDEAWAEDNEKSPNAIVRSCALHGVFSNGYQPKGICYYDDEGNVVDAGKLFRTTRKDYVNGNLQTVWETKNDKGETTGFWIWDGSINEYRSYTE